MLHPSCNVHLPCASSVSHLVLLWVVLLVFDPAVASVGAAQPYRPDFRAMDLMCNNLLLLTAQLFDVKALPTLLAGIAASGLLLIQPSSSTR